MKDTSKLAFPLPREISETAPHTGMTILEYYVAHAPSEPQAWFQPNVPDPPTLREAGDKAIFQSKKLEWNNEWDKQKLIQWPLAWAREQLRQLENDNLETDYKKLIQKLSDTNESLRLLRNDDKEIRALIYADENESTVDEVRRLLHRFGGKNLSSTAATPFENMDIKTFSELIQILLKDGIVIRVETVDGEYRLHSNLHGKYFDVGGYIKEFAESQKLHRID